MRFLLGTHWPRARLHDMHGRRKVSSGNSHVPNKRTCCAWGRDVPPGNPQAPSLILRPYSAWATRPPRRRESAQHAQPTGPKQESLLCMEPVRFLLGTYTLLAKVHAAHRRVRFPHWPWARGHDMYGRCQVSPGNQHAPGKSTCCIWAREVSPGYLHARSKSTC